jgi:hypothetical protein
LIGPILEEKAISRDLHVPTGTRNERGERVDEWCIEGAQINKYDDIYVLQFVSFKPGDVHTTKQQKIYAVADSITGPYAPFAHLRLPDGEIGHGSQVAFGEGTERYIFDTLQWRTMTNDPREWREPGPLWRSSGLVIPMEAFVELGKRALEEKNNVYDISERRGTVPQAA